jgi:hypothetical protein
MIAAYKIIRAAPGKNRASFVWEFALILALEPLFSYGEFIVFGATATASSSGLRLSGATTPPDAIMLVLPRLSFFLPAAYNLKPDPVALL